MEALNLDIPDVINLHHVVSSGTTDLTGLNSVTTFTDGGPLVVDANLFDNNHAVTRSQLESFSTGLIWGSNDNSIPGSVIINDDQSLSIRTADGTTQLLGDVSPYFNGPTYRDNSLRTEYEGEWKIPSISKELIVHAIAAIGKQNQIGLNNKLPWNFPEDLKLFKEKIKDKLIVIGENTYKGMPKSIFKTCTAIVISETLEENEYIEYIAGSLSEAINIAKDIAAEELWICGGAMVYSEALEKKLIDLLHVSHIPYHGPGDKFFPSFSEMIISVKENLTIYDSKNCLGFLYKTYALTEKGDKKITDLADLLRTVKERNKWTDELRPPAPIRDPFIQEPMPWPPGPIHSTPWRREYEPTWTLQNYNVNQNMHPISLMGNREQLAFSNIQTDMNALLTSHIGEALNESTMARVIDEARIRLMNVVTSHGGHVEDLSIQDNGTLSANIHLPGSMNELQSIMINLNGENNE